VDPAEEHDRLHQPRRCVLAGREERVDGDKHTVQRELGRELAVSASGGL